MAIPQLTDASASFAELISQSREFRMPPGRISTKEDEQTFTTIATRGHTIARDLMLFAHSVTADSPLTVVSDAAAKVELAQTQLHKFRQLFKDNQIVYARQTQWRAASDLALQRLSAASLKLYDLQRNKSPDHRPQKDAPSSFEVVDHRIVAVRAADQEVEPGDAAATRDARHVAVERGRAVIEELQRSNCDPRLTETLIAVQTRLENNSGIIDLGIAQIGLARLASTADEELAAGTAANLRTQVTLISMYVAQFPSWRRFTENAAAVAIDQRDLDNIGHAAEAMASDLETKGLSDEETPKIVRAVAALIQEPGIAGKRAAFALLRLLENIISKAWDYTIDLIEKTTTKTIDGISGAAARVAAVGFFTLAAATTVNLAGIPTKVAETNWLQTVAEVSQRQLQQLAEAAGGSGGNVGAAQAQTTPQRPLTTDARGVD